MTARRVVQEAGRGTTGGKLTEADREKEGVHTRRICCMVKYKMWNRQNGQKETASEAEPVDETRRQERQGCDGQKVDRDE